jgi:hypothetical protein
MGRVRSMHRVQEAEPIGVACDLRKKAADGDSTIARGTKLPGGRQQFAGRRELDARLRVRQLLAIIALQRRLEVERVQVRRSPFHEKEDQPFRAGLEVGGSSGERISLGGTDSVLLPQQSRGGQMSKPERCTAERLAAREPAWFRE